MSKTQKLFSTRLRAAEKNSLDSLLVLYHYRIKFIYNWIWIHYLPGFARFESCVVFRWDLLSFFSVILTRDYYWCCVEVLFFSYCYQIFQKFISRDRASIWTSLDICDMQCCSSVVHLMLHLFKNTKINHFKGNRSFMKFLFCCCQYYLQYNFKK